MYDEAEHEPDVSISARPSISREVGQTLQQGPALQVLELANGETIWFVNGSADKGSVTDCA